MSAIVTAAALVAVSVPASALPLTIKTDSGQVRGTGSGAVNAFKGIPFAVAPVGDLRWKPPVPAAKWSGVRPVETIGASCMQAIRPVAVGGRAFSDEFRPKGETSEDCLTVNVWSPAKTAADKLPVMVWIYGGGFNVGSTAVPFYDGEGLASKGVVVVSINYRLGIYGFLAHPELDAESPRKASGNYGLLDQVAGLQWVKRNIAAFGGDPNKVTIFGQSAGGGSVNFLSISPLAKGLFHGAISMNGTLASGDPFLQERSPIAYKSLAQAEKDNIAYLAKGGVKSLTQLRAMSAAEINALPQPNFPPAFFSPIVDGWSLPEDFAIAYGKKRQIDVPFMAGWTSVYYPNFRISVAEFRAWANARFGALGSRFLALYPAETDAEASRQLEESARDSYRASLFHWAAERQQRGPTYLWYFNHPLPGSGDEPFGARAGQDIPYAMNSLAKSARPFTADDHALAALVSSYWSNFAKRADPNGAGLPRWPAYKAGEEVIMQIGNGTGAIPVASAAKVAFYKDFFATRPACVFGQPCSINLP